VYDDTEYDFGGRISLGYQFSDCLFTKATYFGYETDTDNNGDELSVSSIDLVIGQTFKPSDVLTLSPYVGLSYVTVEEDESDTEFDGLGVVLGIDVTRSLNNSFSLYATAKQTIAFGTTDDGNTDEDTVAFISQAGLGVQYDFSNIDANIRLGVEGQWWGGVSDDDSESFGLAGFVLGANFTF